MLLHFSESLETNLKNHDKPVYLKDVHEDYGNIADQAEVHHGTEDVPVVILGRIHYQVKGNVQNSHHKKREDQDVSIGNVIPCSLLTKLCKGNQIKIN